MNARPVNFLLLLLSFGFLVACILAGRQTYPALGDAAIKLVYVYLGLSVFRQFVFGLGAVFDKLTHALHESEEQGPELAPMVSILMPAYNEADVIGPALRGMLNLDYPHYEVIVIDDGSTDATAAIATEVASQYPHIPVRIITQSNAGKAAALNQGLRHAAGELVLCGDADSRLHPQSLWKGVRHFAHPEVGAVAGFVELARTDRLLLLLQELEYRVALNFTRRFLSLLGTVTVVPGPIGMFRRDVLLEVGGYRDAREIFAEDAELTLRLLSAGWRVVSEEDMIAYTEAPEKIPALLRQRYRWNRGIYQALRENAGRLFLRCGWRGRLIVQYLIMDSVVVPVVNVGLTLFFLSHFLSVGELKLFSQWFFAQMILEFLVMILACSRNPRFLTWIGVFLISKFTYAYILILWSLFSLIEEWISVPMGWDKLERTGQIGEAA